MVWTSSPFARTTTISRSSPRERSKAIMSPEGDHTGLESLRPRSTRTSGRTYSGAMPGGSTSHCAAAGSVAAARKSVSARTGSRFLELVAVTARRGARLHVRGNAFELAREEVEVLAPGKARAVRERRLLGDEKKLVVGERHVVVGVVHRFVVLVLREEARVLLRGLQRLDRLGVALRSGLAVAVREAVRLLAVRVAEVGEGHCEL